MISFQRHLENTQVGQFFQVAIHFHPSHPQPNIIDNSFCALVGLLITKLNHYFNDSTETNTFFGYSSVTLKIGDTVPLSTVPAFATAHTFCTVS